MIKPKNGDDRKLKGDIMTTYKHKSRVVLAFILAIALIMSLIPMVPNSAAYAADDDTALTVYYVKGDDKTNKAYKTIKYTATSLSALAGDTHKNEKYLAWDNDQYKVLGSSESISLLKLIEMNTLQSGWIVDIQGESGTKSFGYQDFNNGLFNAAATSKTGIYTTGSDPEVQPILSLSTGAVSINTTAADAAVSSYDMAGYRLLIGLPSNKNANDKRSDAEYIKEEGDISRQISGVKTITVREPVSLSELAIYTQNGSNESTKKLATTVGAADLNKLVHTDKKAFLFGRDTWSVAATNKYIPVTELFKETGVNFNAKDELLYVAADGFSNKQTYEVLQSNKYFYPATSETGSDVTGKVEVGSVLALNYLSEAVAGTAQQTVNQMNFDKATETPRFLMGLSDENYVKKSEIAGMRFVSNIASLTVIKNPDIIAGGNVAVAKTKYTATGKQIKPVVTVKSAGQTLKNGTDYTVSYGSNKLGKGTVKITGKGEFTGTVTKYITINPRGTKIKSAKAGKKKATVKWAKAKDAVTGYEIAYKTTKAKKYKVIKVKGQKKVAKTFKKLKAKNKYRFKIRTYKVVGKDTYRSSYSKIVKSGKIKK